VVHESGIPWDDKSGENLRKWMDVNKTTFYDPQKVALVPMGFQQCIKAIAVWVNTQTVFVF
jgi:uracil-DNA glycosylase